MGIVDDARLRIGRPLAAVLGSVCRNLLTRAEQPLCLLRPREQTFRFQFTPTVPVGVFGREHQSFKIPTGHEEPATVELPEYTQAAECPQGLPCPMSFDFTPV